MCRHSKLGGGRSSWQVPPRSSWPSWCSPSRRCSTDVLCLPAGPGRTFHARDSNGRASMTPVARTCMMRRQVCWWDTCYLQTLPDMCRRICRKAITQIWWQRAAATKPTPSGRHGWPSGAQALQRSYVLLLMPASTDASGRIGSVHKIHSTNTIYSGKYCKVA